MQSFKGSKLEGNRTTFTKHTPHTQREREEEMKEKLEKGGGRALQLRLVGCSF